MQAPVPVCSDGVPARTFKSVMRWRLNLTRGLLLFGVQHVFMVATIYLFGLGFFSVGPGFMALSCSVKL